MKVLEFVRRALDWVKTARKAVVPVVAGIIGLISIPTLGVDPEIVAAVVLVASALGVYAAPNAASPGQGNTL